MPSFSMAENDRRFEHLYWLCEYLIDNFIRFYYSPPLEWAGSGHMSPYVSANNYLRTRYKLAKQQDCNCPVGSLCYPAIADLGDAKQARQGLEGRLASGARYRFSAIGRFVRLAQKPVSKRLFVGNILSAWRAGTYRLALAAVGRVILNASFLAIQQVFEALTVNWP